ncbi:glycolate oxidase subunit GlcE [Seongchinamella sediminis]|uniref:Glycolate oxidase subunit GlcE n=1 Tax=Seongchinamella sediminis TaxID=2283635 RepID=A0A3L7DYT7_9GAMM|nr:glycolate oxidase subunit GlcE [Seongchinamella sediminis]RLQ22424.1 glycolate oxidase subunit GlcE [Seongchinamella sediminis]
MAEALQKLAQQVAESYRSGQTLRLRGGDSKARIIGRECRADAELDLGSYRGVSDYQPGELVLSARAGTPVSELQALLAEQGQTLPFDPPPFAGRATLGGTLACNINGPARPWLGSVRDAVLGVQLINGKGELLEFGGKVMKNVAGYDVSRLQAGALGTLGAITEVHLKVLPLPECTLTLAIETSADEALRQMAEKARQPKPLTGACWLDGRLYLRLAGARRAVEHTASSWGGERVDDNLWQQLRDFSHPFFAGEQALWRLATNVHTAAENGPAQCIDWAGSQRWLRARPARVPPGSHLCLYAGGDRQADVRAELDPVQRQLQRRLKQAMDPGGILNPGRLYSWM